MPRKLSLLLCMLVALTVGAKSQVDWGKILIDVAGQVIQEKLDKNKNGQNQQIQNSQNYETSQSYQGQQTMLFSNIKTSSASEPASINIPQQDLSDLGWLPQNYTDVSGSMKRTVFAEDFMDNRNNWILKSTTKSIVKMEEGFLKLEALSREPSSKSVALGLDQSMNYEIECAIRFKSGTDNASVYFNWGKSPYQTFGFGFSGDGRSVVIDSYGNNYKSILPWTDCSKVKPHGEWNKLTIRKVKRYNYFFINEKLVHVAEAERFSGSNIGFQVPGNSQIEIDYLKVTELLKSDLRENIEQYVVAKVNEWQKKGKYEKTADYQLRVTTENRQKQAGVFMQEAVDKFASEKFDFTKVTNDYDSDNESFKLIFENFAPVYLAVPIAEAENFEKNFSRMKYRNARFALTQEGMFALQSIEIINPGNNKVYKYNSQNQAIFDQQDLVLNFDELKVDIPTDPNKNKNQGNKKQIEVVPDVDQNIPKAQKQNPKIYALIIGNEDYSSFQSGLSSEVNVQFAENDAKIFYQYVTKTLGVPEKNVTLKINATLGQMKQALAKMNALAQVSEGNAQLIFYYSGHGLPEETSKEAYIMPVDIAGTDVLSAIKLTDVYNQLTEYPTERVTVFLDACFSGGARNEALVAMKGVKVKPKEAYVTGNLVVFTSSSGDESSMVYKDKKHGLFTYYLLKKMKETMGDVTYKSLSEYIKEKVSLESVLTNNKKQTPQTLCSPAVLEKWELWKMK
jgi:hypothetical protein